MWWNSISECIERGELKHILTWTKERDQELKDLVELYGKHWVYISRRMKYFSPRECEQRQVDMFCVFGKRCI